MKLLFHYKIRKMKIYSSILILFMSLMITNAMDHEHRIVKLKDFTHESTYLPIFGGQKFTIEVEGNPTTGFIWELETESENNKDKIVAPLNLNDKNTVELIKHKDDTVGKPGVYHFQFQAHEENSGFVELTFLNKRPWTLEGSSKKKILVKVLNLKDLKDL